MNASTICLRAIAACCFGFLLYTNLRAQQNDAQIPEGSASIQVMLNAALLVLGTLTFAHSVRNTLRYLETI
jgi:hypothetical protein